ncbi:MAG TPA: DUF4157 domain-containing protein, partial [Kofleriaceae bacterium]
MGRTLIQQLAGAGGTSTDELAPGKRTLTQAMPAAPRADVHQAAAAATHGPGGALPFLSVIQRAFGRHDVSHIVAHIGDAATAGARAMGAQAFATGHHVAFAGSPSLHTAAHEAAHVVQQAGGVRVDGGVGAVGDVYEQNADAVADAVVGGQSAEPLLDRFAPAGRAASSPASGGAPVQRAVVGGPRYGNAFTNTEDPAFQIYDTRLAAEQRAADQADAWRDHAPNELGALARLTAHYQARPSAYLAPDAIAALTLDEFDSHAHEQADWITGTTDAGLALFSDDQKR